MQKNILIAIFVILLVAILAIFILIFRFDGKENIVELTPIQTPLKKTEEVQQKDWAAKLANVDKSSYYYAVNDLFIQIDLKQQYKRETPLFILYNLVIDDADRYSMFCIKQVLSLYSLPYIVSSLKEKREIVVQSVDKNSLENISNELKKYNIQSKIREVQNEKNSRL